MRAQHVVEPESRAAPRGKGMEEWEHVQVTAVRRRCLADTVKDTLGDVLGVHANKRRGEESQDRDEREFHILTRGRLRDSRRDGRFGKRRRVKPGMYNELEGVFNEWRARTEQSIAQRSGRHRDAVIAAYTAGR